MTKGTWLGCGVLAASLVLLAGCGSEPASGAHGDCSARIHFRDNIFRGHNLTKQSMAFEDAALGTGDVVGCDLDPVDQVEVHKIRGIDPLIAIAVVEKDARGVYVREGTKPSDWPTQLLAPTP